MKGSESAFPQVNVPFSGGVGARGRSILKKKIEKEKKEIDDEPWFLLAPSVSCARAAEDAEDARARTCRELNRTCHASKSRC